jgi:hypothetical protein
MQTIKTSSDKINVDGLIYENDKPIVTRDEYLTLSSYSIETNSYIEKNKVVVIDAYNETNNLIIGTVLNNYNQKILGVSRNDISNRGEVITKGIIRTSLDGTGRTVGDTIYCSNSGDLSLTPHQKRIGTLLTTTADALIFVDIKEKNDTPFLSVTQPNSENSIKIATTEFVNNISQEYKNGKWYPELITDNNVTDLIFANGNFSLLGGNSIYFSADGINWASRVVARGGLYIAYGNGIYITLPNSSSNIYPILRSTDGGASWSTVSWPTNVTNPDGPPVSYNWDSLTFVNGRFFLTGIASLGRSFGQILSSTDGVNWSTPYQNIGFVYYYSPVAFGAGLYACIGGDVTLTNARVYTSGDGMNWTPNNRTISGGFTGRVTKLIFANGLFVAMNNDSSYILTSPDAVNWTVRVLPASGWRSIIYANALYIMVSDKQIITSPDTINWTIVTTLDETYSPLRTIVFGNGTYLISSPQYQNNPYDRYKILRSANLTVFSKIMPTENNTWQSITVGGQLNFSRFVIISSDGTNRIMNSLDGTNWTARAVPLPNDSGWQSVTYGNGLFVAVAFSGTNRVMTSPDSITWTARMAPSGEWLSITYGNGLFVVVGRQGTNRVITSPDGINWTARTVPSPNDSEWNSVTYGNGLFVAVAAGGTHKIMTSPDGFTWTARTVPSPDNSAWRSITYGDGLFVAVASSGTHKVMTSPDGINWTARTVPSPDDSAWRSITYGNGLFVAVAAGGTHKVMTSPDGINWTENTSENNAWQSVIYARGVFIAVAASGTHRIMFSNL